MQMYVNYFDRFVKTTEENSTIGIVLCKQKNKALVEITLPKDANIHAREYQLYLPSKDELQQKLMEWIGERRERRGWRRERSIRLQTILTVDRGKLSPLLKLKYHNAISDAWADLGRPEEVGYIFAGFQKYLYQPGA